MNHAPADPQARIIDVREMSIVYAPRRVAGRRSKAGVAAVRDVSIHVDRGEVVGLVGESGSGKSSLALGIARLTTVSSGSVVFLGRDVLTLGRRALRRMRPEMQIVFQNPISSMDPRQTVRSGFEELRTLHPKRSEWIGNEELMVKVGLDPALLDRFPHQVSGGQGQRICIARALLLRPVLLIADEPTSALDVSVQAHILDLLLRLREEQSIALLFISHDLSVIRRVADRVYVMQEGSVVESGATEALFSNPEHPYVQRLISAIPAWPRQPSRPRTGTAT